jgi:hypothetical protein
MKLINLLGVSHPDKHWFAEQLAQGLVGRGLRVHCVPDPLAAPVSVAQCAALEVQALQTLDAQAQTGRAELDVLLLTQPAANLWGMRQCLGEAGPDDAAAVCALHGAFMNLLLAAPPGVGQWHDASGTINAHVLEGHLRRAMFKQGVSYTPVWGQGQARVDQALAVVAHALDEAQRLARGARVPRWRWVCQDCDDGGCEHESFRLLGRT